ncbi:MAG TPA: sugar phosphate isomerase/epimerase family protein [Vicinamibacterales bacterium]|nr:sugar phosphate isomerase/epimerase family protein [Vicinamibacterales bacterium]
MNNQFSRREFVGMAAAATAWATTASAQSRSVAGPARGRLNLGVASYSMRELPLDQALEGAKTLGVTSMTFKDVHLPRTDSPEVTRALAAKIRAAGITIAGGGTITLPNDAAQIKKDFEYAKNAGFPLIFISPDPKALDTIEQMVKTYDIRVAIHNHGPEDKWWPRPQDAYAAIKSRDRRMGLCIDVGHTTRTGTNPAQACRECRDRLYDMHVKDLKSMENHSDTEVGRGIVNFPELFKALLEIGYQGQVGLEYEINAKNPIPGMIESLAYMRGVLAALTT